MNELEVINFQSHIHSYLEFHKGVNIIRGTSHHGKSALIRAIQYAIENKPRGADFRNWNKDAKEGFESHLSFDQGTISRINRKSFNGYEVNEESFEALYSDVPSEVFDVSRMDESNIWGQDDGYFLLQDSPGFVARKLNERAGLEDIDKVAKITHNLLKEYANRIKFINERLASKQETLSYLKKFEKHKKSIEEIDKLFRQSDDLTVEKEDLEKCLAEIDSIQETIDEYEKILESSEAVKELDTLLSRRLKVANRLTNLRLILEDIDTIDGYIKEVESILAVERNVNELIELCNKRKEAYLNIEVLELWIDRMKGFHSVMEEKLCDIKAYEIEIDDLLEPIEELELCPICGSAREHWLYEILGDR